jgi:putative cell wall-binding protein
MKKMISISIMVCFFILIGISSESAQTDNNIVLIVPFQYPEGSVIIVSADQEVDLFVIRH